MDAELTADQVELQRRAREILARARGPPPARRVAEGGAAAEDLWATLCSLEWPGLALPEDLGGLGQTWVDQAVVLVELGRVAAPRPPPRHRHPVRAARAGGGVRRAGQAVDRPRRRR